MYSMVQYGYHFYLTSVMKLNINPAMLFTKKEEAGIGSTLFKAKWGVVPVKLKALLKRNFLYETFSSKFLRSHSFEVFWVASCERPYNKATLSKVNRNLMTIAGANRIFALKKFRNSPSQMFYKIGLLKNFKRILRKTPLLESLFNAVAGLRPATALKKWLQQRCFPVN